MTSNEIVHPLGLWVRVDTVFGIYEGSLLLPYREGGDCQIASPGAPSGYWHFHWQQVRSVTALDGLSISERPLVAEPFGKGPSEHPADEEV